MFFQELFYSEKKYFLKTESKKKAAHFIGQLIEYYFKLFFIVPQQ
jgi:hypothetical protein